MANRKHDRVGKGHAMSSLTGMNEFVTNLINGKRGQQEVGFYRWAFHLDNWSSAPKQGFREFDVPLLCRHAARHGVFVSPAQLSAKLQEEHSRNVFAHAMRSHNGLIQRQLTNCVLYRQDAVDEKTGGVTAEMLHKKQLFLHLELVAAIYSGYPFAIGQRPVTKKVIDDVLLLSSETVILAPSVIYDHLMVDYDRTVLARQTALGDTVDSCDPIYLEMAKAHMPAVMQLYSELNERNKFSGLRHPSIFELSHQLKKMSDQFSSIHADIAIKTALCIGLLSAGIMPSPGFLHIGPTTRRWLIDSGIVDMLKGMVDDD